MRCQVGDLAVVTKSRVGNEGRIVQVMEYVPPGFRFMTQTWEAGPVKCLTTTGGWLCHGNIEVASADVRIDGDSGVFPDNWLRPLRDNNGQDETIRWVAERAK